MNIDKIKKEFPFFKENKNIHYLDTAASSLKHEAVLKKLEKYYAQSGVNIHRGNYKIAHEATEQYEEARSLAAKFINASKDEIIFTKSTTEALNLVAYSASVFLKPGDELITTDIEHNSSILPWVTKKEDLGFNVKYIPLTKDYKITVENFKKVLTEKTRVIVISHISNVLGYINPIKEITKLAHKKGAIVVLDAAQSAPHIKIDVRDLDVDFLAFSGHKIYGPTGIGVLYGKKDKLEMLKPYHYGGEMVAKFTKDQIVLHEIPQKFEAGTPPIAEAIALGEAFKIIESIGFENLHAHEVELQKYALKELSKLKEVTIYNPDSDIGLITFNVEGVHPHDIATILDGKNICVRAGHHCASLLSSKLGSFGGSLRASFGVYTKKEDIDALIKALKEAIDFFRGLL